MKTDQNVKQEKTETPFEKYRRVLKERSKGLKRYLKGRLIEGTESYFKPKGRKKTHRTKLDSKSPSFLEKKRAHRKMRNKMAYKSRRINRIREGS
jgi:hypothetical protein